jgi:hypothetical protein
MSKDRSLSIFVEYQHGEHPQEENFARTKDLVQRLSKIHPLLETFSPLGHGRSDTALLLQTPIADMDFAEWTRYYLQKKKSLDKQYGPFPHLGISLWCWNRHKIWEESASLKIDYNVFDQNTSNDIMMDDLPAALYQPDILEAIMVAIIDSFDAIRAEYSWYDGKRDPVSRYYQLWLRGDAPFPTPPDLGRYKPNHPPPPVTEHWHNGTLFSWPEHDPRILRREYVGDETKSNSE